MNIGTLDFEVLIKTDTVQKELDGVNDSIRNFAEQVKTGGDGVQTAMSEAAQKIAYMKDALASAYNTNREALASQYEEYGRLGNAAKAVWDKQAAAQQAGEQANFAEYESLAKRQAALGKEIETRRGLLDEIKKTSAELQKSEGNYARLAEQVNKNSERQGSLRAQLKSAREEMARMLYEARTGGDAGAEMALRASEKFQELQAKVGMLGDALGDAQTQASLFANDAAGLQGVISAISGVSGALSVAQGAIGMFSEENENLQKIMLKVQSIMAITTGLQQVQNTLNSESAASLMFLNKIRTAYTTARAAEVSAMQKEIIGSTQLTAAREAERLATMRAELEEQKKILADAMQAKGIDAVNRRITARGNIQRLEAAIQKQSTIATNADTAAKTAQRVATGALSKANVKLALTFRGIGAAIKSVPVIGWIIAGVSALIGVIQLLTKHSREAKKEQQEYYKAVADGAAEPVAKIENLAAKWNGLGNDMKAKQKFVDDNKAAFEELGIKVKSVEDAENALIKNKQAFVQAQIAKSKALAATNKAAELQTEILNLQLEKEDYQARGKNRKANNRQKEIDKLEKQIQDLYGRAMEAEAMADKTLQDAKIQTTKTFQDGTIGYYEQAMQAKQAMLKDISDPKEYAKVKREIDALQKTIDGITGAGKKTADTTTATDPFKAMLDKRKAQYAEYQKWIDSTDEIAKSAATTRFEALLQQGSSYMDYLKRQREQLMTQMAGSGTAEQQRQLAMLNNAIVDETKTTILAEFDSELQRQLSGANSLLEKLAIIEQKRRELNEDDPTSEAKNERLIEQQRQLAEETIADYRAAQREYNDYLEGRLSAFERYQQEHSRLEQQLKATPESDSTTRTAIQNQLDALDTRWQTSQMQGYDRLLEQYKSFEEQKAAVSLMYSEQRKTAEYEIQRIDKEMATLDKNNDAERIKALEERKKKAMQIIQQCGESETNEIRKLAQEYVESDIIGKFLDSADAKSSVKIQEFIDKLQNEQISIPVEIDDTALKELIEKLKELKKETEQSEGSIKKLAAAFASGDIISIMEAAGGVVAEFGQSVSQVYDQVVASMKELGIAGDDITQQLLSDIGGMIGGAADVAAGLASGNYMQAIAGGIQLVTSAIKVFDNESREQQRIIEESNKKIQQLNDMYEQLQRTLARTYDSSQFDIQKEAIRTQEKQLEEYKKQLAELEKNKGKKKFDEDAYDALKRNIADTEEAIKQGYENLAENLTQTTIPDIMQQVTDALTDAIANGSSSAELKKTLDKVADDIMKQAAISMLQKQYLAKSMQQWYEDFEQAMKDGVLDEDEQADLREKMAEKTEEFAERLKAINDMFDDADTNANTLSGAIKGASQESIDLLAGYTNAVRVNQSEQIALIRNQLSYIASIDGRVAQAVGYLENIYTKMRSSSSITETATATQYDAMRAMGTLNVVNYQVLNQ